MSQEARATQCRTGFLQKILGRKMQACAMHLTLNVFQLSPTCHVVRSSAALCLWQLEEQEKMQGKPQRFCFTWPWRCFNQIQAPQLSIWWTGWNVMLYKSAKIMDLKIGPGSVTSLMAVPSSVKPRLCNVWKQSIKNSPDLQTASKPFPLGPLY